MTATRSNPIARRLRTAAAACTATFVVALAMLASPAGALAVPRPAADAPVTDAPSGEPSPAPPGTISPPADVVGEGEVLASPANGGVYVAGTDLKVTARIDYPSDDSSAAGSAIIRIGTTVLADKESIASWLGEQPQELVLTDLSATPIESLDGDSITDHPITVAKTNTTLQAITAGVYPVQIAYVTPAGTVTDNTVITVEGTERADISLVVPITGPAISTGLLSSKQLEELTQEEGSLTISLRVAQESNAIVAVDPAVIAAMRALGTTAPTTVQTWLAEFAALPNDIIALPFADADVTTLVAAGQSDLTVTSLSRYIDAAGFAQPSSPTPSPTSSPAATRSPDLASLLLIPGGINDVVWPAPGTLTTATAEWAASEGKTVLVSSTQVTATQPHVTLDAGNADALVYDAQISEQLTTAATEADEIVRDDELSQVVAFASLAPSARLIVALDRGADLDAAGAVATVTTLTDVAGGRLTGQLLARVESPVAAALTPAADPLERAGELTTILAGENPLAEMAVVLADPTLLTGAERASILQLFSTSWLAAPKWSDAVAEHRTALTATLNAIDIEPLSTIQFLSSGSSIPLRVRNDLPFAATLKLWAQPDDFRLTVESPTIVQAQAGAVTKVLIPVTAGLGNGDVTIRFWLTADNGHTIGEPMFTDVFVRAEWEKFGIIGLASLVALLIGGGIFRTVRKRKKGRKADVSDNSAEIADKPAEELHG